ncbi:hypothetical protein HGM15179_011078 [Zosterops borbonicus]|uniref:Uncharacterized protein n=1 Tax=Zosterops borbonicus TaxID=364589 RepID=A0A8K1GC92_9PASS|nr:hypothetical protein HGM15179_011078 [Zosterops borbonicus]
MWGKADANGDCTFPGSTPGKGSRVWMGNGQQGEMMIPGPEYQDGRAQSSMETSKVLHEILRELKMILGGVNSLNLNSPVSRRSTSAGNSRADLKAVDNGADPNAVVGRADTNAVDANSFQKYCIEGIVAVLGSMLLGMVLCCVLHVWRKRRK